MTGQTAGLDYREFGDESALATRGNPVYGEETTDGWRRWSVTRSKLGWMIDQGADVGLHEEARVLYLGAASGTTVSHVADVTKVVYAVEFAPRPMRDLLETAKDRKAIIPLLKDARSPETYGHVVEADLDLIVQDVATQDQARVALANKRFLDPDGRLVMAIKARSEDVSRPPSETFEAVLETLQSGYTIESRHSLEPHHLDHVGVVARPRE